MAVEKRYNLEIGKFGKRLRKIREQKNLTQLTLELESGLNRTEISRIENGQRNIEFITIVRLAEGLGISLNELFAD